MKYTTTCLLLGLLSLSGLAQAACNLNIPLTRSDLRYQEVADGSEVKDTVTGLTWQRCVVGMSWDVTQKTCTGTASTLSWQDALEEARKASTVPNASAWRVPNYKELHSLVERACVNPAINASMFPATPLGFSWSSSVYMLGGSTTTNRWWSVRFDEGSSNKSIPIVTLGSVRLVRSDQ